MKIAVAGTGYVGLVTGVCLASKGHTVVCVDVDDKKIAKMQRGESPIYEPGLPELMHEYRNNITYTTDYKMAYGDAEVIFIGVGTPEKKDGSANLKYVSAVAEQIAESVSEKCIVVLKSTVPIGTNDRIEAYIREHMAEGAEVHVASNPEFLSQGTAVQDTLHPSRIVIGAEEENVKEIMLKVYEKFDAPKLCTNRRSAEMVKYASNDFLALKISYVNEIANLCESVGADIQDVTKGMGFDKRIGNRFLNAGIGYGGSCFPKDTKALSWLANFNDQELKTIKAAIEVNERQKLRLIKKAKKYYENFTDLKVAVLGLTFKPGTDDLREAPSLENVPWLLDEGAIVKAWDPVGKENFKRQISGDIQYCETIEDTLRDTELCFIFTEWEEVKKLDTRSFEKYMKTPIILDGRNCYDMEAFNGMKVIYDSIGRPCVNNLKKEN